MLVTFYRIQTENGFVENTDYNIILQLNHNSSEGIETIIKTFEFTSFISKREKYEQTCDHITCEILRKRLLGILSAEEEIELTEKLRIATNNILETT